MFKYVIQYENGMFLESDIWCEAETNESLTTDKLEDAVLYDNEEDAIEKNQDELEMGYNSKVVEAECKLRVRWNGEFNSSWVIYGKI